MGKCECGRKTSEKYEKVIFDYGDYKKLKITKKEQQCKECAIEEFLENFNLYSSLVKEKKGLIINWCYYLDASRNEQSILSESLVALGILSCGSRENWEVVSSGLILNPKIPLGMQFYEDSPSQLLFFTRKKDALKLAGCIRSSCEVRKITSVSFT